MRSCNIEHMAVDISFNCCVFQKLPACFGLEPIGCHAASGCPPAESPSSCLLQIAKHLPIQLYTSLHATERRSAVNATPGTGASRKLLAPTQSSVAPDTPLRCCSSVACSSSSTFCGPVFDILLVCSRELDSSFRGS